MPMGSFTSVPLTREDVQDMDFEVPALTTRESLINRCLSELPKNPPLISRNFVHFNDLNEGQNRMLPSMQSLSYDTVNGSTNAACNDGGRFRVLTWNILAQALAVGHDNFVGLPDGTLNWTARRLRILHEILLYDPDVICLQEVDHYNFLNACLTAIGYRGVFCSKPDSPCIYVVNNNGPDGCALFYRNNKFDLISASSRILEIWRVQSNQVCIFATLRLKETGQQVCVATTHLKARQGALLSTMRNEQGKDVANYVAACGGSSKPLVLCGDFNAVPTEPVIETVKSRLFVESAYAKLFGGEEPPYTTWKVRGDAEYCHTIDYIFHNSFCDIESVLMLPTEEQVGPSRLPNLGYASDHIAIACDVKVPL
ncbi:Nocturnin [Orchesella cincta]|uniref:Nocturnin n=1 Tax=Orchesella cincta TaxID=48709 RepID=A0A1D2MYT7_ORCCI|nr:Nocturnin [Orchesella cincta]